MKIGEVKKLYFPRLLRDDDALALCLAYARLLAYTQQIAPDFRNTAEMNRHYIFAGNLVLSDHPTIGAVVDEARELGWRTRETMKQIKELKETL